MNLPPEMTLDLSAGALLTGCGDLATFLHPSGFLRHGSAKIARMPSRCPCRRTGRCRGSTRLSTPMSPIPSPLTRLCAAGNPTGCYSLTFDVDDAWLQRGQTRIIFDGVNSAFHLWCNGRWIGYSRTVDCPPSLTSQRHYAPGRTAWRSWSCAGATAAIWKIRTCGA